MSPAADDAQVVIVGAGPVGMTAALLLARFGVSSVMLESKSRRDAIGSKALCMQRDVLDVLERVRAGLGEQLVTEGVTWRLGRTYYREHELFTITFPEADTAHFPPFVNIGQDRTEQLLEQAVAEQPLTGIGYDHTVDGLEDDGNRVTVRSQTPDGPLHLDTHYVIAADGAHSPSRGLMGIDFPGHSFDDLFLICDIRADLPFEQERRFFFDPEWNPDRQVLIHPQADSVWRIDWQVPPDFDLQYEQTSGALDRRIRKIVGDQHYEIVWQTVYRFHQRIADHFVVGRTFLAGDAAHLYAPFGARGLNSGIQDAENLAWKLGYVINEWAPPELLGSYEPERRAAALENLRVTSETMEFLVPQSQRQWTYRRSVLNNAVTDNVAADQVDSGTLAEPFCYAESPVVLNHTGTEAAATFGPGMLSPDTPCRLPGQTDLVRLRQLYGDGFVVLTSERMPQLVDDTYGPVSQYRMADLTLQGTLSSEWVLDPGTALVVRPDGHIAGMVPATNADIQGALALATGTSLASRP